MVTLLGYTAQNNSLKKPLETKCERHYPSKSINSINNNEANFINISAERSLGATILQKMVQEPSRP